ncbi:MAG: class I SAM-dependent methyltransferase [Armatimonadota bacterium]
MAKTTNTVVGRSVWLFHYDRKGVCVEQFGAGNPEFFDVFFDLVQSGRADVRHGYGGWVPEVYDMMEGDFEDDLPLLLDLAAKSGGPIADLGSGTGRLAIPLASAGFKVYAVDSDSRMHAILKLNADELDVNVEHITSDIRSFQLPKPVKLAVCSTNTFLYLGSLEDQRKALKTIADNLDTGGYLWLDVFIPKPNPVAEEPYLTSVHDEETGTLLLYCAHAREDHFEGRSHVNAFTMVWGRRPEPEIYVQSWNYAWLHPNELRLLLETSGFEVVQLLGDYEGAVADDASVQMIAIARKVDKAR